MGTDDGACVSTQTLGGLGFLFFIGARGEPGNEARMGGKIVQIRSSEIGSAAIFVPKYHKSD